MAEPVIISYARGLLREFPGVPEGTVDVIPVDIVVAAIIAVAALGPGRGAGDHPGGVRRRQPAEVQRARRQRQRLVHRAPALRQRGPADRRAGVPLPGRGRVQAQLTRAKTVDQPRREGAPGAAAAGQAGRVVGREAGDQADGGRAGAGVRRAVRPVHRVRGGVLGRQPARRCGTASTPPTRRRSPSTRGPWTGRRTSARSTCRRSSSTPGSRRRRARRAPTAPGGCAAGARPERHVAAFDLENTLIASNVVESYSCLATRRLEPPRAARYVVRTLAEAPGLLKLDREDRGDFLRHFYRRYEDAPVDQIDEDAARAADPAHPHQELPRRASAACASTEPSGTARSSSPARSTSPSPGLRPLFDEIVAAEMTVRHDGTYSGEMGQVPPTGETRAQILADYCAAEGLRLEESIAYADSTSDLPLLEAVGFPVAVNPRPGSPQSPASAAGSSSTGGRPGRTPPAAADRPLMVERERRRSVRSPRSWHRGAGPRSKASLDGGVVKALQVNGRARLGLARWRRRWPGGGGQGRADRTDVDRPARAARRRAGGACAPGSPGSAAPTCRWSRGTPRRTSTTG